MSDGTEIQLLADRIDALHTDLREGLRHLEARVTGPLADHESRVSSLEKFNAERKGERRVLLGFITFISTVAGGSLVLLVRHLGGY